MTADITAVPLTTMDETRLSELERVVEAGLQAFVEVGTALAGIQAAKLYRATHATFEAYVKDRFGISRPRAYGLISSAETATALSSMEDIPVPTNERQARALAGLDLSTAADVMVAAAENNPVGRPTATAIKHFRNEMVAPRPSRPTTPSAPASPSRPAPAPAPDEDDDDTLDGFDAALTDLQMETRRLTSMDRLRVPEAKELSLIAATVVAELAETLRQRRALVDPVRILATELAEIYTNRSVEVIEQDIEAVLIAARKYYMDLHAIRKTVTAKYDRSDESRTVPGTAQVVIEVGSNTAVVTSGWPAVRSILERLGVRGMKDHRRGLMCFPAKHADDVQAHAEFRRQRVELVRHDDR